MVTVEFYDVDPLNVVWHGNYMRFFETARSVLLNHIDYNYQQMKQSGYIWPVVDYHVKYIKPLFLQKQYRIEAGLIEYENRLKIHYRIYDVETSELLTKATSIQVAIKDGNKTMEFITPPILHEKIKRIIQCNA